MDITQLRYFLKAAATLNYTQAAESLFISRQALRQALTTLEQELGQPLFENHRNHLSLTQYGEYLALSCADVVKDFEYMQDDVKRFFQQKVPLRFAFSVSLTPYLLPGLEQFVLRDFALHYPQIALQSLSLTSDQVIDAVERRETDCGCVLQMPVPCHDCSVTVIRTSPVALNSGENSPYRGRPEITLEELAMIPVIGMGSLEKIARPLWDDCQRLGITLDYHPIPNTIDAIYQVKNGYASSLTTCVPDWNKNKNLTFGRIQTVVRGYTWELVLICPKDSPAYHSARLLASYIADYYGRLFTGSQM